MNRLMPDAFLSTMRNLASSAISGTLGFMSRRPPSMRTIVSPDFSDDDLPPTSRRVGEAVLECPICWESFNIVENVPYILWCGHTLCKTCFLGLQWAVVKVRAVPLQIPLFISCPWCHKLSFRCVYKGKMKYPRKNFFVLWMIESLNGQRIVSNSHIVNLDCVLPLNLQPPFMRRRAPHVEPLDGSGTHSDGYLIRRLANYLNVANLNASLRKALALFVIFVAKLPFLTIFLLILLGGIPISAVILVVYLLITILFAFPAFLVCYFALPILNWLFKEIGN